MAVLGYKWADFVVWSDDSTKCSIRRIPFDEVGNPGFTLIYTSHMLYNSTRLRYPNQTVFVPDTCDYQGCRVQLAEFGVLKPHFSFNRCFSF